MRWSSSSRPATGWQENGPIPIGALAGETWAEDNEGSAALLRQHAARAGVVARIDLRAADLPGKIALVATGHAIALIPGVLVTALRADVTAVALADPPTRGIYSLLPRHDKHPSAPPLLHQITMSFGPGLAQGGGEVAGARALVSHDVGGVGHGAAL